MPSRDGTAKRWKNWVGAGTFPLNRCGLALSRRELFEKRAPQFLQLAKTTQIVLEFVIEQLRILRPQLIAQNHVTQFYRVRQEPVFLQFFQRLVRIVVIHDVPPELRPPIARNPANRFYRKEADFEGN